MGEEEEEEEGGEDSWTSPMGTSGVTCSSATIAVWTEAQSKTKKSN